MPFDNDTLDEINLLIRFNLHTAQEGIKVHSNADKPMISAAQRLFDKNLISQKDGGYLTGLGRDAAEHAQSINLILNKQ